MAAYSIPEELDQRQGLSLQWVLALLPLSIS
jgi:hypothetical protein